MARIAEEELERLKNEVAVERLVEAAGLELKKSGRDWIARCPFHADDTASLVVTPSKNLWHCFGCGAAGGPIDWVMKLRGISFRHAVEQLREGLPSLAAEGSGGVKRSSIKALAAPVAFDADDQALLNQAVGYYHERLRAAPEALAYLASRGLEHLGLVEHFRLGVADRTLGLRLPDSNRKAGADIRSRLQKLGLYRESGHEHFNGSLVVPVFDEAGDVVEVYGRKLLDNLRAGTPKHLYLPAREGRGRGVFNVAALKESKEIILCEALIDALTFWCAGYRNVTSAYGIEGFTQEHVEAFKRHGTQRVLIAYDRDDAGERGALKVAQALMAEGIECLRIQFPKGMDANEYAGKVQPAEKSLGLLIRKAVWLGKGESQSEAQGEAEAETPARPAPIGVEIPAKAVEPPTVQAAPSLAAKKDELLDAARAEPKAEIDGDVLRLACGARTWQVRGVPKAHPGASLKLNVRVQACEAEGSGLAALHVDSVDLYSARSRAVFAAQAAAELGGRNQEDLQREIGRELGRVLLAVEQAIEGREAQAKAPKQVAPTMSEAEQEAALAWLRAPDLLGRIAADFDACGLVGEATNKLTAYLACVSRLLASPLAVVVQSSSAAGKTSLMDAVLAFMPQESRIRYSAMTGQSLYYMGQTDLKHRILALAEEEGAARASYALKLLQSDGELTMAATGKDPTSGNLVTQEYHVEGPVMLMLTTTAIEIDEELMNRCLVLTVDEGSEQTRAIHARQRERRTLSGLMAREGKQGIQQLHQQAQRLLRPLAVVNPFAEQLSFHAQHARARRDHEKYLTLIDTVALLHQHQRPIRRAVCGDRSIEYIEVTREDIEAAHAIAHEVLGRSLDELPPVTRKLLCVLSDYVAERARVQRAPRDEVRFTRRELREACGWGDTQLRLHLERLAELELLGSERGGPGGQLRYTLKHEATGDASRTRLCGLVDPGQLDEPAATTAKSRGVGAQVAGLEGELAGCEDEGAGHLRADGGPVAGGSRGMESAAKPALVGAGGEDQQEAMPSRRKDDEPAPVRRTSYEQAAAQ
jgi:DNA primase